MHMEYELDRVLRRHSLGYAYFSRLYNVRVWRDENLAYVTIGVPYRVSHRFQKFWRKAVEQLGPDLDVYYIQHGVPMEQLFTEYETLYFIKKESALKMLQDFYKILLPELDD